MSSIKSAFKNSLKKLSLTKSVYKRQTSRDVKPTDISAKCLAYQESVTKPMVYKNVLLPGDLIYPKVLDDLGDFEVRADDIWIVSYPQSGSAVVEEIVTLIVNAVNRKSASRRQREAQVAQVEMANPYGHLRWLKALKSPRIFTTNLPIELIPEQLKQAMCRIIYLVRNPKDQLVAYYYHHRVKGVVSSFDDFVELYMNGHLLYGDWFTHVSSYWQLSQTFADNVLFISYEEIKIETKMITKLIVNFLGFDLPDEEVETILSTRPKRISQHQMESRSQSMARIGSMPSLPQTSPSQTVKQSKFEGIIGDWQNYLSPEQSRKIDELFKTRFAHLSMSMAFDPTDALRRLQQFGRIVVREDSVDAKCGPKRKLSTTRRRKVSPASTSNRPELTDDEKSLLRSKSLNMIPMSPTFEVEESVEQKENCWTRCARALCPCVWKKSYEQM